MANAPAHPDGADDRTEVVLDEHDRGSLARDIGAALAHCHANMGGFESGRVVNPYGHRDHFASSLKSHNDSQLLFRPGAGKHGRAAHSSGKFCVVQRRTSRPAHIVAVVLSWGGNDSRVPQGASTSPGNHYPVRAA